MKLTHQTDGLLHIRLRALSFLHAEAIRPGETIIDSKSCRHQKLPVLMHLCRSDAVSQKAGTVFKASSVKPRPLPG